MPWRYYRRRWRWRRRPWWSYGPRTRKTFRTRRRKRRYRVRKHYQKRKLSRITVRQYQPRTIKRCNVKGLLCLVYFNKLRLAHNSVMYENAFVPEGHPGGGGFSVIKLTLEACYDMFLRCHNWWTQSNDNLPLVRYTGTSIKLYQSEKVDYVFKYSTTLPGKSSHLTYPACQPGIMMMSKHSIIVPSKITKPKRKPYIKIFIKPPPQLTTKWYFQTDLNKTTLLTLYTAACSLNSYYLGCNWDSNNVTITHINTKLIQNLNFRNYPTTGYAYKTQGTESFYLYATTQNVTHTSQQLELQQIIALTDTKNWTRGNEQRTSGETVENYKKNWRLYAGNPFAEFEEEHITYLYSKTDPNTLFNDTQWTASQKNYSIKMTEKNIQLLTDPMILKTRYNPNRDQGTNNDQINQIYLVSNQKPGNWETPVDPKTLLTGFPIWLGLMGYADFQKKQNIIGVDEQHIICIKTHATKPYFDYVIVPIGESFLHNKSPYQNTVHVDDRNKWYPQTQYQNEMINTIVQCGPGTAKIDCKSDEIKCEYTMHFKWGGDPAKMLNIENPAHQDYYPVPNNDNTTITLQNPAYPPEYYLYSFDERKGQITGPAAKRIKQDWPTKATLFESTGSTKEVDAQTTSTETSETEDEEKEAETLYLQLLKQRHEQRQLRKRIKQLTSQLQSLE
nr:MAG: ORF1 [TTV-like mini virus]